MYKTDSETLGYRDILLQGIHQRAAALPRDELEIVFHHVAKSLPTTTLIELYDALGPLDEPDKEIKSSGGESE